MYKIHKREFNKRTSWGGFEKPIIRNTGSEIYFWVSLYLVLLYLLLNYYHKYYLNNRFGYKKN